MRPKVSAEALDLLGDMIRKTRAKMLNDVWVMPHSDLEAIDEWLNMRDALRALETTWRKVLEGAIREEMSEGEDDD